MTFIKRIALIISLVGCLVPNMGAAQPAAYLELTNATNATLIVEIVRDANRSEFVVATVPSGATETGSVPSGVVTMTITAPHSDSGARFTQSFALNTDEGYELVITPQMFGLTDMRDDDLIQPTPSASDPSRFYETCAGITEASRVLLHRNPNGISPSYYYEAGPLWCHDGGEAVYIQHGDNFVYWGCTGSYQNCGREESWDGFLGDRDDEGVRPFDGRDRYYQRYPFNWSIGTYAPYEMTIYE